MCYPIFHVLHENRPHLHVDYGKRLLRLVKVLTEEIFPLFSQAEEMAKLEQYHSKLSSKYERNTIR
jgi:energy-converting hydrogenase A subunit M